MCAQIKIFFLLLGLQRISMHTIAKFEIKNGTEVYEVRELPNDTVQFINPKAKKPTLREITFYRVIEKPYVEEKKKLPDTSLEFDESIRPFTNSHGMQFVDWGQLEDDFFRKNNETSSASNKRINSYEDDDESDKLNNEQKENSSATIDERFGDVSTSEETNTHQDDQSKSRRDANFKLKKIRKQLFDSTRSKYRTLRRTHNDQSKFRQKRDINYTDIPQAPTLPALDVHSFPDYIQKIFSNRPAGHFPASIKNGLHQSIEKQNTRTEKGTFDDKNRRTYGMSLRNNQGYSWNNIPNKLHEHIAYIQHTTTQPTLLTNVPYQSIKESNKENNIEVRTDDMTINKEDEKSVNGKIDQLFTNSGIFSSPDENKLRTYQNIPEAPVLPALDVYSFPDNIQKVLSNIPSLGHFPAPIRNGLHDNTGKQNIRTDQGVSDNKSRRTYGMSLRNNQGYSWNNIPSAQPERVAYTQHTTIRPNPITNKPYQSIRHFNKQNTLIDPEVKINKNKDDEYNGEIQSAGLSPPLDESQLRTYGMSLRGNTGKVWNDLAGTYYDVGDMESNTTENSNKATTNPIIENTTRAPAGSTSSTNDSSNKPQDKENIQDVNDDSYDNTSVNKTLTDFLTKDELWDLLTKWTKTYTRVLNEQISKLIQDEVTRQLKEFNKVDEEINTSMENDTYVPLDDTNNNESTESEKDSELEKKKASISSNKKSPIDIKAQTIYGNSVGNGNVTNIFVFFPNTENIKKVSDETLDNQFSNVDKNTDELPTDNSSYLDKNKDQMTENADKNDIEATTEAGGSSNEEDVENELSTASDTTTDTTTDDIDNITEISRIEGLSDQSLERSAIESIETESEDTSVKRAKKSKLYGSSDEFVCLQGSSLQMCNPNETE